jgi:hypothetical protein
MAVYQHAFHQRCKSKYTVKSSISLCGSSCCLFNGLTTWSNRVKGHKLRYSVQNWDGHYDNKSWQVQCDEFTMWFVLDMEENNTETCSVFWYLMQHHTYMCNMFCCIIMLKAQISTHANTYNININTAQHEKLTMQLVCFEGFCISCWM